MVKLIYGLAKFSKKKYGFGSRPKKFNKKKFLLYISKLINIFECSDRYIGSNKSLSSLKKKKIHFKIDKIPYRKSKKEILIFFLKRIQLYKKLNGLKKIDLLYLHENNLRVISNDKVQNILLF